MNRAGQSGEYEVLILRFDHQLSRQKHRNGEREENQTERTNELDGGNMRFFN